jgi:hypothetical protein
VGGRRPQFRAPGKELENGTPPLSTLQEGKEMEKVNWDKFTKKELVEKIRRTDFILEAMVRQNVTHARQSSKLIRKKCQYSRRDKNGFLSTARAYRFGRELLRDK